MISKLQDSTNHLNRAEKDLQFSPRFERFIRNKYDLKELKNIDANKITKEYNLKGIVFGNYVTQEERYFYLYKTAKQIECLALIKKSKDLGKGKLILSIGANGYGGNINAHYSPSENLINLARGRKANFSDFMKGENSFVHEYGHFIDFEQGRRNDPRLNYNFASENLNPNWTNKKTLDYSRAVDICTQDEEYMAKIKHSKYLKSRIEIWARLFEASINHYIYLHHKEYIKFFERTYSEGIYYPKDKILKAGLQNKVVTILRDSK